MSKEPIEKLEEMIAHLQSAKKEFSEDHLELEAILKNLLSSPPPAGTKEHAAYIQAEAQIKELKERVSKRHSELMETLKEFL
ncbi:MAG: hypothetical protein A3E80_01915 [Chlamydiae bacterium RIFCSPHIGHO2_12_FULL_49_9]|nr:MAG: hypothetical protein A3E80_01915 [Chlamydiae bacterium RIFCSPHIGHO2_12_FULL_49_9]